MWRGAARTGPCILRWNAHRARRRRPPSARGAAAAAPSSRARRRLGRDAAASMSQRSRRAPRLARRVVARWRLHEDHTAAAVYFNARSASRVNNNRRGGFDASLAKRFADLYCSSRQHKTSCPDWPPRKYLEATRLAGAGGRDL